MHLWQIRHIPNRQQTLLRLTFAAAAFAAIAVSLFASSYFVTAKAADEAPAKADAEKQPSAAEEFLQKVRQELPKHQSIKAEMVQLVAIGDQKFKINGEYLSAGKKLRLNYSVSPEQGVKGEMLEVCDGKELWTMLTLPDTQPSKRVTRRNVKQILEAAIIAEQNKKTEDTVSVELGLGGLTALFASLDRTMDFDGIKEDEVEGTPRTIIQGRWKKDRFQKFAKDKDNNLPLFIPDMVRIYVNTRTMFPEKILYLKQQPQKKTFKALVSIEFHHVEFDGPVDDDAFAFSFPDEIVPEDVTRQYLERMTNPGPTAPAPKP